MSLTPVRIGCTRKNHPRGTRRPARCWMHVRPSKISTSQIKIISSLTSLQTINIISRQVMKTSTWAKKNLSIFILPTRTVHFISRQIRKVISIQRLSKVITQLNIQIKAQFKWKIWSMQFKTSEAATVNQAATNKQLCSKTLSAWNKLRIQEMAPKKS